MGRIDLSPRLRVKRATITATVIRADGTVEELGVIAETRPTFFHRLKGALAWPRRS